MAPASMIQLTRKPSGQTRESCFRPFMRVIFRREENRFHQCLPDSPYVHPHMRDDCFMRKPPLPDGLRRIESPAASALSFCRSGMRKRRPLSPRLGKRAPFCDGYFCSLFKDYAPCPIAFRALCPACTSAARTLSVGMFRSWAISRPPERQPETGRLNANNGRNVDQAPRSARCLFSSILTGRCRNCNFLCPRFYGRPTRGP